MDEFRSSTQIIYDEFQKKSQAFEKVKKEAEDLTIELRQTCAVRDALEIQKNMLWNTYTQLKVEEGKNYEYT
jgi:hypothetical protein